jgi:hypothetical protein
MKFNTCSATHRLKRTIKKAVERRVKFTTACYLIKNWLRVSVIFCDIILRFYRKRRLGKAGLSKGCDSTNQICASVNRNRETFKRRQLNINANHRADAIRNKLLIVFGVSEFCIRILPALPHNTL